jgi:1-aminocyclopropane-1-carboxylate deaminase
MSPKIAKLEKQFSKSTLTRVISPLLDQHNIGLWIKRDDQIHSIISGNKWRKLKHCLAHALSMGSSKIVSMGGPYSNHLHALAYAGNILGLETEAYVRGEQQRNPTLDELSRWGMVLHFVSRLEYRALREGKPTKIGDDAFWLPEGGATDLALLGVAELVAEIDMDYDVICCPCGTGATLAGLVRAVPATKLVLGFSALKNGNFLNQEVEKLASTNFTNWKIVEAYHFGGFARSNLELVEFIRAFHNKTQIQLEPVYTGKMIYGIEDMIRKGFFSEGQRIIAIHTGGLQGNRGLKEAIVAQPEENG